MISTATTPDEYLSQLSVDRYAAICAVRDTILQNLQPGFEEQIQYGMLAYRVPLDRYRPKDGIPAVYVALASQKQYMSLDLLSSCTTDGDLEWFRDEYIRSGKKLNMGKGCVRFRKLEDLPLELVERAVEKLSVEEFIQIHSDGQRKKI